MMRGDITTRRLFFLTIAGFTACGACSPAPPPPGGAQIKAVLVATGLNRPVDFVATPDDTERAFIVEQPGTIRILNLSTGQLMDEPFLDIRDRVNDGFQLDGERGLFSVAFHPDHFEAGNPNEGHFFVHYSDNDGATTIERYAVSADPNVADADSSLTVLSVDQPFANHNGGTIAFGPDGYLYIGLGDGGSANDPGNRAQDDDTFLGKLLRIDVDGSTADQPYAVPPDNPFVGEAPRDEIWAKGLRNPWRFSFDRLTGDLFIADVGQGAREEVDFQPADVPGGRNYGWRCLEGTLCTSLTGCDCSDAALTPPIYEYDHSLAGGFSITGGYVYRGQAIPALSGRYLFGDFVLGRVWSLRVVNGEAVDVLERTAELAVTGSGGAIGRISSFGQDASGELYLLDRGDATTGRVFRIERADESKSQSKG